MRSTLIICVFLACLSYVFATWIKTSDPIAMAREQQAFIREMTGRDASGLSKQPPPPARKQSLRYVSPAPSPKPPPSQEPPSIDGSEYSL
jgi:type IV secretory pathway VirB10-like protein